MNPYELQRYISVYNQNPYLFDDDLVDEIEKASKDFDVPFTRNVSVEEDKQESLLNQFVSGVSEGFTTLGWAEDPKTEFGQIAHSMGHLIGFAPAILAGPLGFLGKKAGAEALKTSAKFLAQTKSVPFYLADKINTPIYKGLTKAGINVDQYVKKGNVYADIAKSAQELGVASAISSVWGGKDEIMNSYVHGAIFGGAFGTIGNFTNLGNMLKHPNPSVRSGAEDFIWNKVVRGGLGAALQGGLATAQDAPTSVQLYEYLLGGFFGYKHPSAKIKSAKKYIDSFYNPENDVYGKRHHLKEREMLETLEFKELHPVSQEHVKNYWNNSIGERFSFYNPQQLELGLNYQDPTAASLLMQHRYLEGFKQSRFKDREQELLRERKQDKLSQEEENLAKVRAMNDVDAEFQRIQIGNIASEITDRINGSKAPIGERSKDVLNKLTKEQQAEIKKGNINVIYDVITGEKDTTMGAKEARDLQNLDRPVEDQLELDAPNHIRNVLIEIESTEAYSKKEPKARAEILDDIISVFNKSVKTKESYETFFNELNNTYPEYIATPQTKRQMRSVYNRMIKEELHTQVHFDRFGNRLVVSSTHDISGKRIADNKSLSADNIYFRNLNVRKIKQKKLTPEQQEFENKMKSLWGVSGEDRPLLNDIWEIAGKRYKIFEVEDVAGQMTENFRKNYLAALEDGYKRIEDVLTKEQFENYGLFQKFNLEQIGVKNPDVIFEMPINKLLKQGKKIKELSTKDKTSDDLGFKAFSPNYKIQELKTTQVGDNVVDLYGKTYNKDQKKFVEVMKSNDWLNLSIQLDKENKYAKIPKKDKGVERIYPYHPNLPLDSNGLITKKGYGRFLKRLQKEDPMARLFLAEDYTNWIKEFGGGDPKNNQARNIWQKQIMSNFLYEPKLQFKNAPDRVKRETIIASKGIPQDIIKKYKEIEFVLVDDEPRGNHKTHSKGIPIETYKTTKDGKTASKEKPYLSEIDGYGVLPTELYNELLRANGFSPETSRLKPTISAYIDGELFLFKGGFHPSQKEYDVALKKPNRGIAMLSAAKAFPKNSTVYHGLSSKNKDGTTKYEFKKLGDDSKTIENPEVLTIKLEDLRIDYGVAENSKASKGNFTIKKQFHVLLNELQISEKGFNSLMETAFQPNIKGVKEANQLVRDLANDPNTPIPEKFRIRDIGDAEFVYLVNNPSHPLFKRLLMRMTKQTAFKESADAFGDEQHLIELEDYVNRLQRWSKYSNYDPIVTMIEPELYNAMVLRYRKNKYLYPEWKYSGEVWGAGNDPVTKVRDGAVKNGTFKLGIDMAGMPVKWGKNQTLGDLWAEYQSVKKRYDSTKIKANKKTIQKTLNNIEEMLEIAVMRVPSPAVSGTRILRFDGFIENSSGKKDYGAYLHPKDHFYLDGMDVDGDKVFLYQGLPKEFKKDIKKNANELAVKIKNEWVMYENKAKELNSDFGTTEAPEFMKSKLSQIMPFALRKSGISSYNGKEGMGAIVNAKTVLNFVTADIISNKQGKVNLDLINNKGNKYGTVELITNENQLDSIRGFRRMAWEASSRTADSSNYWEMMPSLDMREVLLKSAFTSIKAKNNKGKKIDFKYKDLINTSYGDLVNVNSKLYGKNWQTGKQWNAKEVQDAVESASSTEYRMNSLFYLANQMSGSAINQRYIRGNKKFRNLIKQYNEQWKSPDIRNYFGRKKFSITPFYMKTDRKELELRIQDLIDSELQNNRPIDQISINNLRVQGLQRNSNLDPRYQRLFDQAKKDGLITPHDPITEAKLLINDMIDLYSAITLGKRGKSIADQIIDKGGTEQQAFDFLYTLAERAVIPKLKWRDRIQGIRKTFEPQKFAMDDVNKSIKEIKREIAKDADALGVSRQEALDYFHWYMMGSIYPQARSSQATLSLAKRNIEKEKAKPSEKANKAFIDFGEKTIADWSKFYNKTSFTRFAFETKEVPERLKKEFMQSFAKMVNVVYSSPVLNKMKEFSGQQMIPEQIKPTEGITGSQKTQEAKIVLERLFDNIFQNKPIENIPKDKIPEDIPRVLDKLIQDFRTMPEGFSFRIEELFANYQTEAFGKAKNISEATYMDLRNFQEYIRRIKVSTAKEPGVKKMYYYLFPERVGEKQLRYDATQLYKRTIPLEYEKGKVGFLDIRLPYSTFNYLSESFTQLYGFENIDKEYNQEYIQRYYGWREQILNLEDGTTEFSKLHRAAISKRLAERESVGTMGDIAEKTSRRKFYNELWEENRPFYEELKNKIYKITEEGKTFEKTGAQVMDWISEKHKNFFDSTYKKWVVAIDKKTGESLWDRIDKENRYGVIDELVEFTPSGRLKIERIQNKLFKPAAFGKQRIVERLINNTSLSVDLLNRIQYEIILEQRLAKKENIGRDSIEAKKFRERNRALRREDGEYNPLRYVGIGKVEEFYWPQMDHRSSKKGRDQVKKHIDQQMYLLKNEALRYARDLINGNVESTDKYNIKKRWITSKNIQDSVSELLKGVLTPEQFADRILILQEVAFEKAFLSRSSEDGGAGEHAIRWLNNNKTERNSLEKVGFNNRPGSGRERGETPMPGFSLEFEVAEKYSGQWIASFYKNLTSLIAHDTINRFSKNNVLYTKEDREDWENFMKMYARDVMGYSSSFSSDVIGLNKDQLARTKQFIERIEKRPDKATSEELYEYKHAKDILKKDKRLKEIRKTAYFHLSDDQVAKFLERVATKLGGKANPKLPLVDNLPKDPEARKIVLMQVAKNIGAFEAKWSLISLLSHPKTAIGNLLGGNVNTISNNGLRHFTRTKDKAFLYNIFKGGKLKDGTEITPDNVNMWLNRFAEESGALESFIVSEASLERGFRGKKVKNFLSDFVSEVKKDYNMPDQSLMDIAKKHGLNKAFVDGGAWFMRKSERMLRRDSFLSHYLANYEILKDIVPNLKYDNPYLLRMATEGVKATQFLYHSSARPAFSRTTTGKILTRFMPFAWNSIRFRRLAYQKAATYGFDINTIPGKRLQRVLMLDMFAFALANIFVSSIFDSALPPPMSYMQDTADWLFGDEKQRERAFFNQWPHPALAPLSTVTGPSLRLVLAPTKAIINNDWEPFLNYQAWTLAPFGRLARSMYRTYEVPEMWLEEMTGIPIHRLAQKMKKARKEEENVAE